MKNRIICLFLAVTMLLLSAFALFSCKSCEHADWDKDGKCTECGEVVKTATPHTVKLVDYKGAGVDTTALVNVYYNGESVGFARPNDEGVATVSLIPYDYTVKITFLDEQYYYDTASAVIAKGNTELSVPLYSLLSDSTKTIYVPCKSHKDNTNDGLCDNCGTLMIIDPVGHEQYDAKNIGEGASRVEIDRAFMTYFIFTPTRSGVYQVKFDFEGEITCGYFGAPHFVQPTSAAEVTDNAFEVTVLDGSVNTGTGGTSQLVFGVGSSAVTSGVITIERVRANAPVVPYTEILPEGEISEFTAEIGATYVDFNVTSSAAKAVYNENDGLYHYGTADGPVILLKISADKKVFEQNSHSNVFATNSHLDNMPFATLNQMLLNGNICCFFYAEDGETVIRKELYNPLVEAHVEKAGAYSTTCIKYDDAGTEQSTTADVFLIPLNKQLADAIKNNGEHNGWWDLSSGSSSPVFGEHAADVYAENAWLFMCCYKAEEAVPYN